MESQREAKPLLPNQFPLSFEGEGDTGGEDGIMDMFEHKFEVRRYK